MVYRLRPTATFTAVVGSQLTIDIFNYIILHENKTHPENPGRDDFKNYSGRTNA